MTGLDIEQKQRSSNYTGGEKAGNSWTDRVMGVKGTQDTPTQLPQDVNEGVDDDEWVGMSVGVCTRMQNSSLDSRPAGVEASRIGTVFFLTCRMTEWALQVSSFILQVIHTSS